MINLVIIPNVKDFIYIEDVEVLKLIMESKIRKGKLYQLQKFTLSSNVSRIDYRFYDSQ